MGRVFDLLRGGRRTRNLRVSLATTLLVALWASSDFAAPVEAPASRPDGGADQASPTDAQAVTPATAGGAARADDSASAAAVPLGQQHEWQLVMGRHWQIVGPPGEDPAATDAREGTRGSCPVGMVEVRGRMKLDPMMDLLQQQTCTKWISQTWPERCGEFDAKKWAALSKDMPTQPMSFCIDRFEYPNRKGAYPIILVTWYEARDICKSAGKRLCTEDEWTFACEGEQATPYPNGYVRDPEACLNDRPWRQFHGEAFIPRGGRAAMLELDHLWQGQPSGSRPLCRSHFGVYDMTGNIDEWTRSSIPGERPSVLKGGYWGPVRTRCRPATKAHDEGHMFYQQGLRCCADTP